ncbi:MAG TPA: hypothetical protein VGY54_09475 [Polyangiaceae bacterium]|nr:hypothetical protein [Polyangiaceae bacterium]
MTIWHPDEKIVDPLVAYGLPKHFRGIRVFVPTGGTEDIPGARVYLGEIEATEDRAPLN